MLPVWFNGYHSDSYIDEQLPNPPIQILLPELIQEFEYDQNHYLRVHLQDNDLICSFMGVFNTQKHNSLY